jgi:protein-tyrosine phosphatase
VTSAAYGLVFAVLAANAAFAAALASEWVLRGLAGAAALSLLLVAVAYFGGGPRLLFKRPDGRRSGWAWAVHWPYFALTAVSYRLTLCLAREAAFTRITPNVFLGRRLTAGEARRATEGWRAVLDLVAEMPEVPALRAAAHYRSLPVLDATALTPGQLRAAVGWVHAHAASGPVYVHCALGHGRSALVVAAYLLATGQATDAKGAVARLRELRPGVRLSRTQRAVLDTFAVTSAPSA